MTNEERIEKMAEAIYRAEGGLTDEDYVQVHGKARLLWKTEAPWDSQPDVELCEHERDGYRAMARAAFQVILEEESGP